MFSGANLIHDTGYLESGLSASLEMMVIVDEIISFARRLMRGIELTPETLALDVIEKVGLGGCFLKSPHTRQNYRQIWYPCVFDRHTYSRWIQAGQPTAIKTAHEIARDAVTKHRPVPLLLDMPEKINAIVAEADRRAGLA